MTRDRRPDVIAVANAEALARAAAERMLARLPRSDGLPDAHRGTDSEATACLEQPLGKNRRRSTGRHCRSSFPGILTGEAFPNTVRTAIGQADDCCSTLPESHRRSGPGVCK